MNDRDSQADPLGDTRGPRAELRSVGRVDGATRGSELAPLARRSSLLRYAVLTGAFVAGWVALTVIQSVAGLPAPFVAIPILVVALIFGVAVLVLMEGPREPDPAEARWAAERERERASPQPYRAPPAPAPALTAATARPAFVKFAAVTLAVWLVPLGVAAATGEGSALLLLPYGIILTLYGLAAAMILALVARGAWNATWYGHPPPIPRWIARASFGVAFAIGVAAFFAAPMLFAGPLGLIAFLVLPLALAGLAGRRREPPSGPADGHPHGVSR